MRRNFMKYFSFAKMYYFSFFGGGALFTYLAKYLSTQGYSGSQIGLITSMGAFLLMISRPLWGYFSDRYHKTRTILIPSFLIMAALILVLPFLNSYFMIVGVMAIFYVFHGGTEPIQTNMALKSPYEYGKLRKWGAVGFAISVALTGFLIDYINIYIVFVIVIISYIVSAISINEIKMPKRDEKDEIVQVSEVVKLFKNKKFVTFLIASFFIWGTIFAHNTYFALFFENIGGTMSGVGFAILLFAGSEVPVMSYTERAIKKFSLEAVIVFATAVFLFRWLWYLTEPTPLIIMLFFIIQGLSVGVYIVVSNNYIKSIVQKEYRGTALAIYASITGGFSPMIYQYLSGRILESYGVQYIYALYASGVLIGSIFVIKLYVDAQKTKVKA
ncbi:MAG: MFS transporter [Fusobacteriota bacterium]